MKILIPVSGPAKDSPRYPAAELADIAEMLEHYRIPHFAREPLLVIENGKRAIAYADFFLPTYNGLALDYIVEAQSAVYRRKKNVYQDNQIPAVLVSRRDLRRPHWQKRLYGALQETYHRQGRNYAAHARRYP